MFKSLKRIVLYVQDVTQAQNWYTELLSVEPVFKSDFAAIYKIGDSSLTLAKSSEQLCDHTPRAVGFWEVDNVDDAYKRLLDMGAKVKVPPTNNLHIRTAQVLDPFGNLIGLTGGLPDSDSIKVENKPSETAHLVTICRSLASKDDRFKLQYPDTFSEIFLKDDMKTLLVDKASRSSVIDTMISPPLYGFFIARTNFIDDLFINALKAKILQIVFLGAGYDTRAFRFESILNNTRIFELDIATTQNRKRECIQNASLKFPEQVSLVSVNFKTENFIDKLTQAGFDTSLKTLFIWEGVAYYLPIEAVNKTMELLSQSSTAGVDLCFDYMTRNLGIANPGEPFLSWIEPTQMQSYVEGYGFKLLDHIGSEQMYERYLKPKSITESEKPFSAINFVYAEK